MTFWTSKRRLFRAALKNFGGGHEIRYPEIQIPTCIAFVLAGEMVFAYFVGHMFQGGTLVWHPLLNGGSLAIALCFTCLYIASAGPGPWSLDATHRGKV